ncbi:MAG: class I SAM-dependent methyltransferase [Beijerinckiaceae bacterium]
MNPLEEEIRQLIASEGPISVERYMALALGHPQYGYYVTRDPFGTAGDFVTAPEISQMFGELLGLWAAEIWFKLGSPGPVHLVELGPGRGTLMADALRAARVVKEFQAKLQVHLVETSPKLREIQREKLADHAGIVHWHDNIEELPEGPCIVLANEFFDALPICQYVMTEEGWRERLVGTDGESLVFGLAGEPEPLIVARAEPGAVLEAGISAWQTMHSLTSHIVRHGGALLAIDYGHTAAGTGDTLQAMQKHARADPLESPGEADLTAHVDFSNLARAAKAAGAAVSGPVIQADFLTRLGIFERAAGLKKNASVRQAIDIDRALLRLVSTGEEPGLGGKPVPGMGVLFKVLGVASKELGVLPGFESREGNG